MSDKYRVKIKTALLAIMSECFLSITFSSLIRLKFQLVQIFFFLENRMFFHKTWGIFSSIFETLEWFWNVLFHLMNFGSVFSLRWDRGEYKRSISKWAGLFSVFVCHVAVVVFVLFIYDSNNWGLCVCLVRTILH